MTLFIRYLISFMYLTIYACNSQSYHKNDSLKLHEITLDDNTLIIKVSKDFVYEEYVHDPRIKILINEKDSDVNAIFIEKSIAYENSEAYLYSLMSGAIVKDSVSEPSNFTFGVEKISQNNQVTWVNYREIGEVEQPYITRYILDVKDQNAIVMIDFLSKTKLNEKLKKEYNDVVKTVEIE
ncbi:hypothetical protein [Nonlabens marinus]|uniref:Lipoprotein n=1 Tax=Nonlabens marinus S1-08 TaxID=1454201 RepID=W8VWB7_9FLAO|nr:hypothetical protein [Nonlabens marinus]BAO56173.1 hypothetical protein NMS_2164 [Nonlabens marinus S1-08]